MNIPLKLASEELAIKRVEEGGIRWVRLKNKWILNRFLWQKGLLRHLKENDYDTLVISGVLYYITTWAAAILYRIKGKKVIFWTHGFLRKENNLLGFFRTQFYKLADFFLVYGQRGKDIMVSKGFDPEKIELVYNSLDYDEQIRIRASNENPDPVVRFKHPELPCIGYIGRVLKQKKLDILIETIYDLKSKEIFCNSLIIGDGPDVTRLKSLVAEYGLSEYFCFYGPCYDEKIIFRLLSQTDIIVSPGEVGLTAIHAMTYGLPVITHNRFDKQGPEYACIEPGLTGDFFDYDNPVESLSSLLAKWLNVKDKVAIKERCYTVIDKRYNPYVQLEVINSLV
jgi:glycosyltransferase involved in cell wall biosynthesis